VEIWHQSGVENRREASSVRRLELVIADHSGHIEHLKTLIRHLFGQFCGADKQYVVYNASDSAFC